MDTVRQYTFHEFVSFLDYFLFLPGAIVWEEGGSFSVRQTNPPYNSGTNVDII